MLTAPLMIRCGVVALLLLLSCTPPAPPPPDPLDCVEDADCPSGPYFFCDTVTSKCTPSCRADADCNSRPAEFPLPQCEQGLGCHCELNKGLCFPRLCSADSECDPGLVCRDGACGAPPPASTIAGCAVTPDFRLLRAGERARFHVLAWDAQQAPVILPTGASWALPDGATVYGNEVELLAPATSTFTVRASFGAITCDARGISLPPPGAGQLAALVFDERTGRPISGVKVVMSARDGTVLQQVDSDATGTALLQQPGAAFSLTAFHAEFSYLTIANAGATTSHLTFALRRNPLDRYGGFTGTFGNVPQTSNVHFARVGWSLGSELAQLDLSDPPRPWVDTEIRIGSAIDERSPVPAGSFLGFGAQRIKSEVWALGASGTCLGDEAAILTGACGTGTAWALAADVPLGSFPVDLIAADQFAVLHRLYDFSPFSSWVQRDVSFTLRPTPGAATGAYEISDRSHFQSVTPEFGQLRLAFEFPTTLPPLPRYQGRYLDRAFVVGGAFVPGRGFVPLGLGTAINDEPVDPFIDRREPLSAGQLSVRMAPTHHGLEGAPYALISQASSVDRGDRLAGKSLSAIITRLPGNTLRFAPVDLSSSAFPPVPEGGRFDWSTRTFRLPEPVAGVSVLRVSFTDAFPTSWDVLVDPASPGFTLPEVPGTLRDRLLSNGERSRWSVQAQRLETLGTFASYLAATETVMTGYSREEIRPVRLMLESAPALSPGSNVALDVEGFRLGTGPTDDGVIALSFTGGTNCPSEVVRSPTFGQYRLPLACVGSAVTMRAELMERDGTTPLTPPVAWSITVSIR